MILYFISAGVPIGWRLEALYANAYGIAAAAASSWCKEHGNAHFILQIEKGLVTRSSIFWPNERHLKNQMPDDRLTLQFHRNVFDLDPSTEKLAHAELLRVLIDEKFALPREEWTKRYPAQSMIDKRFADFNKAHDAANAAGESLLFEPKWAPFMEPPEDWKPAYDVAPIELKFGIVARDPSIKDPTDGKVWDKPEEALAALRLLNTGWTWDEAQILLRPEPIEC